MVTRDLIILFIMLACVVLVTGGLEVGTNINTRNSKTWWLSPDPIINAHSLSPCYSAINYHILERNEGRLNVFADQTAQFSLSLNETTDCSMIWVRVFVTPITLESAALVDSETDSLSNNLADSRIVAVHRNTRFPVRLYARGLFLGYSAVHFQALPSNISNQHSADFNASQIADSQWVTIRSGRIATYRVRRVIDFIFQGFIFVIMIFGNIGIGLNINWTEIRDVLKKPIGPAIGFCCQYIIMPLTGFTVTRLIKLQPNVALGIFLIGCAPGGGGSNMHSYFLGGNLPLSVTMTFVSTIAAVGMMPLWVFTLGRIVANETESGIKLDVRGIIIALVNSIVPFSIGIFINWRRPLFAKLFFRRFVRPLMIFIFIYMVTIGTITNLYVFKLLERKVLIAGLLLPYTGFIAGFIVALLLRQNKSYAITIAIETGIQAIGIALATLFLSLPQPDADIAVSAPMAVGMWTPLPLWFSEIILAICWCFKKKCRCCCPTDSDKEGKAVEQQEHALLESGKQPLDKESS